MFNRGDRTGDVVMKAIELGDSGRDVVVWQRFLAMTWFADAEDMLHGEFDDATDKATRAFQEAYGLFGTGIVDRLTIETATVRGLDAADSAVPWQPTRGTVVWYVSLFALICVTIVSILTLQPQNVGAGGAFLYPISPTLVPGSPPPRKCPDWFC